MERNERLLEGAVRVGDQLCATARWHGERCNWIGHSVEEMDPVTELINPMVAALGADLYSGSAGVGLFLAELHALTGSETHRRTARAALWRSLDKAPGPALRLFGLHSGALGIAYAAGRAGWLLEDRALFEAGLRLGEATLAELRQAPDEPWPLDIISGDAGGILALLALGQLPGGGSLVEAAVEMGERLCRRAERMGAMWLWHEPAYGLKSPPAPSPDGSGRPAPLTGYSHGAAGIGLGLLELHAKTGDPRFREAGLGALTYEDHWFSAQRGNWPDLRSWAHGVPLDQQPVWGGSWCHGAPGIGLARARAMSLVPDERPRLVANLRVAVETTRQLLRHGVAERDATLCHGTSGLGETLLYAGLALPDDGYRADALALGEQLLDVLEVRGAWLSGVASGGPSPTLMLGDAGVGYFLLRLCEPGRVPSVLLPEVPR
jgi:lantibiotic modifying enzyme